MSQNLKTITEIMDEIQQEKLEKARELVEREILDQADRDGNSQLDPESRAAKKRRKVKLTEDIQEI